MSALLTSVLSIPRHSGCSRIAHTHSNCGRMKMSFWREHGYYKRRVPFRSEIFNDSFCSNFHSRLLTKFRELLKTAAGIQTMSRKCFMRFFNPHLKSALVSLPYLNLCDSFNSRMNEATLPKFAACRCVHKICWSYMASSCASFIIHSLIFRNHEQLSSCAQKPAHISWWSRSHFTADRAEKKKKNESFCRSDWLL